MGDSVLEGVELVGVVQQGVVGIVLGEVLLCSFELLVGDVANVIQRHLGAELDVLLCTEEAQATPHLVLNN